MIAKGFPLRHMNCVAGLLDTAPKRQIVLLPVTYRELTIRNGCEQGETRMDIRIQPAGAGQLHPKPADESKLVFGKTFSDHMFIMEYLADRGGWQHPRVVPYQSLALDPAAMVLHYGQGIFEGLKAYRCPDGRIQLFRQRYLR